jgi:hypothetical protein
LEEAGRETNTTRQSGGNLPNNNNNNNNNNARAFRGLHVTVIP